MIESYSSSQADYLAAISANKLTVGPDVLDYLDVLHCEESAGVYECFNYQPDWTGDKESDGYPRLGRGDVIRFTSHVANSIWPSVVNIHELEQATTLFMTTLIVTMI